MEGYVVSIGCGDDLHGITPLMFHLIYTLTHTYTHKSTHTPTVEREEGKKKKEKKRGEEEEKKEARRNLKKLNPLHKSFIKLEEVRNHPCIYIYMYSFVNC